MRNVYSYDTESEQLIVTQVQTKSLEDIKRVVNLNKPIAVVDKFIALYLPMLEQVQLVADAWYEEHVLVESLDPDEQRFTRTTYDSDGNETIETLPNAYDVALAERDELESSYEWLKALRGVATEQQPPSFNFDVDVEAWKEENGYSELLYKQTRKTNVEQIKVEVDGVELDGDETSQTRLARAGLGLLAAKFFAIENAIRNSNATSVQEFKAELIEAIDAPTIQQSLSWVAADNTVTELNAVKTIDALVKAGSVQSQLWHPDFVKEG